MNSADGAHSDDSGAASARAPQFLTPDAALLAILGEDPAAALTTPRRIVGLLMDHSAPHERQVTLLVTALEAGVPDLLLTRPRDLPVAAVAQRAADLLNRRSIDAGATWWAVATWAEAVRRPEVARVARTELTRVAPSGWPGTIDLRDATLSGRWPEQNEPERELGPEPEADSPSGLDVDGVDPPPAEPEPPHPEPEPPHPEPVPLGRPRRSVWWVVGPVVLLVGAAGVIWARGSYLIRLEGESVQVSQGFGIPGLRSERHADVRTGLLPGTTRDRLRRGLRVHGRDDAEAMVTGLRAEAAACQTSVTPPCPSRAAVVPVTDVSVDPFPAGNTVHITWQAPDNRAGVMTMLAVGGRVPPAGCPQVLTSAGSCSFEGDWDRPYAIVVTATAAGQPSASGEPLIVRTYDRPNVSVTSGDRFTYQGGDYCAVVVTLTGLLPDHPYSVDVVTDSDSEPQTLPLHRLTDDRGRVTSGLNFGLPDVDFGYSSPTGGSVRATLHGGTLTAVAAPWECPSTPGTP